MICPDCGAELSNQIRASHPDEEYQCECGVAISIRRDRDLGRDDLRRSLQWDEIDERVRE
ncbi:hypothetical protein [Haloplanus halophilus]|uniref:hypothetical protein n=1 Tax=Haloplanus halophilus TaxID=2949993 RepID=UPI00203EB8C4|nr:hypothetical protein [Haloplanus sp. GDY1]